MIFRQLDVDGDWTFGKGRANYAQAQAAIALNIRTALKSWVGDCSFDLQMGIDWKRHLNTGQQTALDQAMQSLILRSYGVTGIVSSSASFAPGSRLFTATYTVNTIYGTAFTDAVRILSGTFGG